METEWKRRKETEKDGDGKRNFRFPGLGTPIIHEAIAVTAIAPLLNLNLNYEKLQGKFIKSFIN